MPNLIQYIVQDDPELEMSQNNKKSYTPLRDNNKPNQFSSKNLLENDFSYLMKQQTPTPWAKKQASKNLEANPKRFDNSSVKLNRPTTSDIVLAGLEGFGEGVLGGIEYGINSATGGVYDAINDAFFDGGYEKRQKALENLAKDANLGKAYKYSKYAIDIGVNGLTGSKGIKKAKNLFRKTK